MIDDKEMVTKILKISMEVETTDACGEKHNRIIEFIPTPIDDIEPKIEITTGSDEFSLKINSPVASETKEGKHGD